MKIYYLIIVMLTVFTLNAQALFEVKDASDQTVLEVSDDGLRIFNAGDTLMVISSTEIKAFIDESAKDKALSRSFSITTSTAGKGAGEVVNVTKDGMMIFNENDKLMDITGNNITAYIDSSADKALSRSFSITTSTAGKENINIMDVTTEKTSMREGTQGNRYTDFSEDNIFLGLNAGQATTVGSPYSYSGKYNIFIGNEAGSSNTEGYLNTITGYMAGYSNLSGHHNTFYGYQSGMNNISGNYNSTYGYQAGYELSSGSSNCLFGYRAGYLSASGENNVCIGTSAGYLNSGDYNTFLGYQSGYSNNGGDKNVFVGMNAGYSNTTANNSIFLGYESGFTNNGSNNIFIGNYSAHENTSGYLNTYVGHDTGYSQATGFYNSYFGYYTGRSKTGGNYNVFLGPFAGTNNSNGSGNVFIGYSAGYNESGSDKLYIDNSNTATPLIYGDFDQDYIRVNGFLSVDGLSIANLGNNNLGLNGDIVPYLGSSGGYDLGNNVDDEYWNEVVAQYYITHAKISAKDSKSITKGLDAILKLRPVSYKSDRQRFGLIPEEVEEIIPEVVISQDIDIDLVTGEKIITDTDKGLNYNELIPVLIKSIQEQQNSIKVLREENEILKNEINEIKNSLNR